jgi:hypothetical protein
VSLTKLNSLIGGAFGLLFVVLNASRLSSTAAWTVRVLGVVAFLGLVGLALRRKDADADEARPAGVDPFRSRGYRLVVVGEVVAIFVGIALLRGPLDLSRGVIGWVSFVVGLHFIALARVWPVPFFTALGAAIAVCGAAGLVAAGAHASAAAVALIAGVLPGVILLGSGYAGALGRTSQPARPSLRSQR